MRGFFPGWISDRSKQAAGCALRALFLGPVGLRMGGGIQHSARGRLGPQRGPGSPGLEKGLLLGGVLGTNLFFLLAWLRCQGLRPRLALSPLTAALRMRRCPAGFVYYFTGRGMHFAAFVPAGQGRFRFLNAVYGRPVVCTLDEFRRRYARLSCCFLFTVS